MIRTIARNAREWPPCLNELGGIAPVTGLFVDGLPLDPIATSVAVVGTRRPTGAGIEAAQRIARGLAEAGFVVVSGLAVGIDAVAHAAALDSGGRTVAVLGCGLDVRYPFRNLRLKERIAAQGTLVSEYEVGTPPASYNFPARNRIIAGLSTAVVVIEGSTRSGALVTARHALEANRGVYAVPGSVRNPMAEGPNHLIRTGQAALVTSIDHIFEDLAPSLAWSERDDALTQSEADALEAKERAILQALDDAPIPQDRLLRAVALKPGELAVALAKLEVRALITRTRGGYLLASAGARARAAWSGSFFSGQTTESVVSAEKNGAERH